MNIVCLDLEGVLVPEIWIAFAKETGIPELEKTTRDEPDFKGARTRIKRNPGDNRKDRSNAGSKGVFG